MTPHHMELTGSLGILAGIGKETLTLSLDERIPEDAVTVALKGDNGTAKSTLMNIGLVPWREPPCLPSDLYSEFGPKGSGILEWSHDGVRYRSEIKISQSAKTKNQKAYLYEHKDGKWETAKFDDGLTVNGNTKPYDQALERILGPMSLYYLSAFQAQNSGQSSKPKDAKELMRDLLGLEEIEHQIGKVKLVVREIKRELDLWQGKSRSVRTAREELAGLEESQTERAGELARIQDKVSQASSRVTLAEDDLKKAEAGAVDAARIRRDYDDAKLDLEASMARIQDHQGRKDRVLTDSKTDSERALANYRVTLNQTEQQIRELGTRIEEAEGMLSIADQVEDAKGTIARLEKDLSAVSEERNRLDAKHRKLDKIADQIAERKAVLDRITSEGNGWKKALEDLERQMSFVDLVPCGGKGEYASCPALAEAADAGRKIPHAKEMRGAKAKEWSGVNAEINQLLELNVPLRDHDYSVSRRLEEEERVLSGLIGTAKITAAKSDQVARASAVIEQAQKDMVAAKERAETLENTVTDHEKEAAGKFAELKAAFARELNALEAEAKEAQAKLDATPKPDDTDPAAEARSALASARQDLDLVKDAHARAEGSLQALRCRIAEKSEIIAQSKEIEDKASHIADELALYQMLAVALRGVIDLTIEDAGPAIAATANDLLEASFGSRFQIEIVTQCENAKGDLVETFDIVVYDSESGLRSSLIFKSGGESVWLNKAWRDAVGLYHQSVSGKSYETLFGDEVEDGLTSDKKSLYYRMQRATLERGGYRKMFFVSHNPEAWAVADAVIEMESLK